MCRTQQRSARRNPGISCGWYGANPVTSAQMGGPSPRYVFDAALLASATRRTAPMLNWFDVLSIARTDQQNLSASAVALPTAEAKSGFGSGPTGWGYPIPSDECTSAPYGSLKETLLLSRG